MVKKVQTGASAILLLLAVVILIFGVYIVDNMLAVKTAIVIQPTQRPTPSSTPAPVLTFEENSFIIFERNLEFFKMKVTENKIARYQEDLYFIPDGQSKVMKYSIPRQTTEEFFTIDDNSVYLNALKIIGDEIFISEGVYQAQTNIYYKNLRENSDINKLGVFNNGLVAYENGQYWIKGGDGDACGGFRNRALFDVDSKKVYPELTTYIGCIDGDREVGIDKLNNIIIADAKSLYDEANFSFPEEYKNVVRVDPTTGKKTLIVPESRMPDKIEDIVLDFKANKLLLVGPELYVVDLEINTMVKKFLPPTTAVIQIFENNQNICIDSVKNPLMQLDLSTFTLNETNECKPAADPRVNIRLQNSLQSLWEQLDLPSYFSYDYK